MALLSAKLNQKNSIITIGNYGISLRTVIVCMVLVVALIAISVWARKNFEKVSISRYQLTERANHNPYYATELLLNASATQYVENSDGVAVVQTLLDSDIKSLLDDLPPATTMSESQVQPNILIIDSIGSKLSPERFMALQHWIEAGGHLITFVGSNVDDEEFQSIAREQVDLETLKSRLNALNDGNTFLNHLGIVSLYSTESNGDFQRRDKVISTFSNKIKAISTQINTLEKTLTEKKQANADKDDINSSHIKKQVDKLLKEREHYRHLLDFLDSSRLILLPVSDASSSSRGYVLVSHTNESLQLNTQAFRRLLPDASVSSHIGKYDNSDLQPAQIEPIKSYLAHEYSRLTDLKYRMIQTDLSELSKQYIKELDTAIDFMVFLQQLPDTQLLAMFSKPSMSILDIKLGQGRLTVLPDDKMFANPNPNRLIYKGNNQNDLISNERLGDDFFTEELSDASHANDSNHHLPAQITAFDSKNYRQSLASGDNAQLLLYLTKASWQQGSKLWILPHTDILPLPNLLWQQARLAVLGLGLLVIIWLWSLYNRFGKAQTLPAQDAHDILRYFRQIGRFGWQYDNAKILLESTRRQLLNELKTAIPEASFNVNEFSDLRVTTSSQSLAPILQKRLEQSLLKGEFETLKQAMVYHPSQDDGANALMQWLTENRIKQALFSPLQSDTSPRDLTEMTQTMWLIRSLV